MAPHKASPPLEHPMHGMPSSLTELVASSEPEPRVPKDTSTIPTISPSSRRCGRWLGSPEVSKTIQAWIEKTKFLINLYDSDYHDPEYHPAVSKKLVWKGWDVYDAIVSPEDRARLKQLWNLCNRLKISKQAHSTRKSFLKEEQKRWLLANQKQPIFRSTDELLQNEDLLLDELYPSFVDSPEALLYSRWIQATQPPISDTTSFVPNNRAYRRSPAPAEEGHAAILFLADPTETTTTTSSLSSNAMITIPKEIPSDFQTPNSYPQIFPNSAPKQPGSAVSDEAITSPASTPMRPSTLRLMPADRGTNPLGSHPKRSTPSPMTMSPFFPIQQQQHVTISPGGTHYYSYHTPNSRAGVFTARDDTSSL